MLGRNRDTKKFSAVASKERAQMGRFWRESCAKISGVSRANPQFSTIPRHLSAQIPPSSVHCSLSNFSGGGKLNGGNIKLVGRQSPDGYPHLSYDQHTTW